MLNEGDFKDVTGRGGCVQSTREGAGPAARAGLAAGAGPGTGEVHTDPEHSLKEQVFNG